MEVKEVVIGYIEEITVTRATLAQIHRTLFGRELALLSAPLTMLKLHIDTRDGAISEAKLSLQPMERASDWIGKVEYDYQCVPHGTYETLDISIILSDGVDVDAATTALNKFLYDLLTQLANRGYMFFDVVEAFLKTLDLLTSVREPYNTRSISVEEMEDKGGDYPSGRLEYAYFA